jgi:hypothetical protein
MRQKFKIFGEIIKYVVVIFLNGYVRILGEKNVLKYIWHQSAEPATLLQVKSIVKSKHMGIIKDEIYIITTFFFPRHVRLFPPYSHPPKAKSYSVLGGFRDPLGPGFRSYSDIDPILFLLNLFQGIQKINKNNSSRFKMTVLRHLIPTGFQRWFLDNGY